jgi:hypothetical protein
MIIDCGRPWLLLEINNMEAMIFWEQKPTLFLNGFIFIHPDELWSQILPPVEITIEGQGKRIIRSFIRSKTLVPIILEMIDTLDVLAFNQKWSGKILTEELEQVTEFYMIDQVDHFTI